MDALGGVIRQPGQHIGEPSLWIDVVDLGGGNKGVDRSRAPAALIGAGEGPVSSYGGPVAELSFKVGVDDPLRFTRSRTVGADFSLTPRRHQSGTSIDYEGRIKGDVSVREALCEAAASLLLQVRKWSALRAWGLRVAKRSSMLCAIVAVARKLAGILDRMWVDGNDFKVGFGAKVTQRLKLKPAQ